MRSSHELARSSKRVSDEDITAAVREISTRAGDAPTLAKTVLVILAAVRELGLLLLRRELERRDDPYRERVAQVTCPEPGCGTQMERARKLEHVCRYTMLGKLHYWRCCFQCPKCRRRVFPLDQSLSLAEALRGHSEELGSAVVLLCTLMPFGKGCELLGRLCGLAISTRLACALTMGIGTRLFQDEMQRAEQLWQERTTEPEKVEPTPATLRKMPRRKRVYVMTDNSKVGIQSGKRGRGAKSFRALRKIVTEARGKAARLAKRTKLGPAAAPAPSAAEQQAASADLADDNWRDVRALLIFDERDLATCSKKRKEILRRRVLAHVGTKEEWLKLVHLALHEEGVYTAEEVVVVADGGNGIWEMIDELLPSTSTRRVTQILDWYHAASHLWAAGRALRGCRTAAERAACAAWVRPLLDYLAEGKVANVLQRLRKITTGSENALDVIRKCIDYFDKHRGRMRYAWYRKHDMVIGSGAIESVHGWVIQPRCRLPGMRWSIHGANAILRLRCSWASGRWDEDFERAARQAAAQPHLNDRNLMAAA